MEKITMQDIADALGISRVTVSKAFNNQSGVSDTLRDTIFEKARELGYAKVPYTELEKLEKQAQQATEFQFSMLGDAIDAMKPSTEANGSITNKAQDETENTLYISGLHVQQEEQALQQGFHVAIV